MLIKQCLYKYSKQAIKFLKKRDMVTRKRIVNAINHLPAGDVKSCREKKITACG